MALTRREWIILAVNLVYVPAFTLVALGRSNYEFLLYVVVILVVGGLILANQRRIEFDTSVLWGLTVWGFMHMAGGNVPVGDSVLYSATIVPLIETIIDGEPVVLLRYDQIVHAFGFGVATLVCHHLLAPYLVRGARPRRALFALVVFMGCGLGALNEVIEFIAVVVMPETGVGGYYNTALDLVANLIGATCAATLLVVRGTLAGEKEHRVIDRTS